MWSKFWGLDHLTPRVFLAGSYPEAEKLARDGTEIKALKEFFGVRVEKREEILKKYSGFFSSANRPNGKWEGLNASFT